MIWMIEINDEHMENLKTVLAMMLILLILTS